MEKENQDQEVWLVARSAYAIMACAYLCLGIFFSIDALGAEGEPIRRVSELREIDQAIIDAGVPVDFEGIVTYYDPVWSMLYLQQDDSGIFVFPEGLEGNPVAGNRVRLLGETAEGEFISVVAKARLQGQMPASFPKPVEIDYPQLSSGEFDSRWVSMEGSVWDISYVEPNLRLTLLTDERHFNVFVKDHADLNYNDLRFSRVTVTGVATTQVDESKEPIAGQLFVPSGDQITVDEIDVIQPFTTPLTRITELVERSSEWSESLLRKVRGEVVELRFSAGSIPSSRETEEVS